MDAFTLIVAAALAALTMAASMGLLYLASARQACLIDWTAAAALFALSNGLAAVGLHQQTNPIVFIACVNALHIGGHFGMLAGVRRHLRLAPGWRWGVVLMAGLLAAHGLLVVREAPLYRLVLFTPFVGALNLGAAWLLWRRSEREVCAARTPLIVLQVLSALQQVARVTIMLAYDGQPPGFLGGDFFRTSGALAMLVYLSLAAMCCALIVSHQQTLALRRASLTDVLTGWLNRRALHDIAMRDFRRCRRTGSAMFFITFDIDHFKPINDRYGHGVGDAAICHVTALSARVLRGYDALFRIGGEEFAVLVVGEHAGNVCVMAERLREAVVAAPLILDGKALSMTISVGVAALDAHDHKWEEILHRADQALYHAKQNGRNRVSVHGRDVEGRGQATRLQAVGA
nr:GGDEF domain-containing protein [Massilia sp. JS1662]